jgi:DNA-binding PadR family transcriptional regulator
MFSGILKHPLNAIYRAVIYIAARYNVARYRKEVFMNEAIISSYLPMSETAFYILLSLTEPRHGYGIMQYVSELTNNRIRLGAGTLYGSISKMEKDGIIHFVSEENKRKSYTITASGRMLLDREEERITELYMNANKVEGRKGGRLQ